MQSFRLNHLHLKTPDPKATAQFYVDNLGATIVSEIPGRGVRLNLHGLTINMTTLVKDQSREQSYGMEHLAIDTDDLPGTVAKLTASGATLMEELVSGSGRKVCFLKGPDGVQFEILEMQS